MSRIPLSIIRSKKQRVRRGPVGSIPGSAPSKSGHPRWMNKPTGSLKFVDDIAPWKKQLNQPCENRAKNSKGLVENPPFQGVPGSCKLFIRHVADTKPSVTCSSIHS
jgi:hypothetical protein